MASSEHLPTEPFPIRLCQAYTGIGETAMKKADNIVTWKSELTCREKMEGEGLVNKMGSMPAYVKRREEGTL